MLPDSFWEILSTNEDDDGLEFVSLIEAKRGLPIWGSQFHPEKNAFEWTTRHGHEVRHVQVMCIGSLVLVTEENKGMVMSIQFRRVCILALFATRLDSEKSPRRPRYVAQRALENEHCRGRGDQRDP